MISQCLGRLDIALNICEESVQGNGSPTRVKLALALISTGSQSGRLPGLHHE
jgi:hypothetical protein